MRVISWIRIIVPVFFLIAPLMSYGANEYIIDIFTNLEKSLGPIWQFISALCYVMGIWCVALAIFKLEQYGKMTVMMATQASMTSSIAYLVVGAGLLFIPSLMDVSMVTVWGYNTNDIRGYDDSDPYSDIMGPIFDLVKVIGYIAFVRGWILLVRLGNHGGSPPGTLSKGLMHMIGGIFAINIVGTIDVLKNTFGLN